MKFHLVYSTENTKIFHFFLSWLPLFICLLQILSRPNAWREFFCIRKFTFLIFSFFTLFSTIFNFPDTFLLSKRVRCFRTVLIYTPFAHFIFSLTFSFHSLPNFSLLFSFKCLSLFFYFAFALYSFVSIFSSYFLSSIFYICFVSLPSL